MKNICGSTWNIGVGSRVTFFANIWSGAHFSAGEKRHMSNKAITEKKTTVWCHSCKATTYIRHPHLQKATHCPLCGKAALVEAVQNCIAH